MKTVQEQITDLQNEAVYAGMLTVPRKPWQHWQDPEVITELKYYFDADMVELGYTTFEGYSYAGITRFDTPREWHPAILAKHHIHKLRPSEVH